MANAAIESPIQQSGSRYVVSTRSSTFVIGGRDLEAGAVSVRLHHGGPQGAKPKAAVIAGILAGISERWA